MQIGLAEKPRIKAILQLNEENKKNDYEINYAMRSKFRAEKKLVKEDTVRNFGLNLSSSNLTDKDFSKVKNINFKSQASSWREVKYKDRKRIWSESIFSSKYKNKKQKTEE